LSIVPPSTIYKSLPPVDVDAALSLQITALTIEVRAGDPDIRDPISSLRDLDWALLQC